MPLSEADVREILRLIDESDVEELRVETEAFSLYVRRGETNAVADAPPSGRSRGRRRHDLRADDRHASTGRKLRAQRPYVDLGARVEPDTVVCLIEVMKMMNPIPAGVGGTIVEVCATNAEPVEYGAPALPRAARPMSSARRHRRHHDARRSAEPLERHRAARAGRPRHRADDRPRGLPRRRLHLEHAHGRRGPLLPGGPVGAHPPRQRGDALDAVELHRHGHALHHVDAVRTRT